MQVDPHVAPSKIPLTPLTTLIEPLEIAALISVEHMSDAQACFIATGTSAHFTLAHAITVQHAPSQLATFAASSVHAHIEQPLGSVVAIASVFVLHSATVVPPPVPPVAEEPPLPPVDPPAPPDEPPLPPVDPPVPPLPPVDPPAPPDDDPPLPAVGSDVSPVSSPHAAAESDRTKQDAITIKLFEAKSLIRMSNPF